MNKLVLAGILITLILLGCGKEVTSENQRWTYENGKCTITFKLKNNGSRDTDQSLRIVARQSKGMGKGAVVGEMIIIVRMRPHEEKELTETLTLLGSGRPDTVVVSDYKAR